MKESKDTKNDIYFGGGEDLLISTLEAGITPSHIGCLNRRVEQLRLCVLGATSIIPAVLRGHQFTFVND